MARAVPSRVHFYPRPPRGGRPHSIGAKAKINNISIHALREEGDRRHQVPGRPGWNFYPRPPRGGRPEATSTTPTVDGFLSTPSARRATRGRHQGHHHQRISIHALREEGDGRLPHDRGNQGISIHALREEGDSSGMVPSRVDRNFYPRPPRGGRRTRSGTWPGPSGFLSTPSARRATTHGGRRLHHGSDFYPRPPRGGRRLAGQVVRHNIRISIHALREEGDVRPRPSPSCCTYFYPRPPRGGRPRSWKPSSASRYFYPRPPRGGRRKSVKKGETHLIISIHALREEGD